MKKIRLIACALAVASFGFTSCNDDDDEDAPIVYPDVSIAGTYALVAVNTGSPTDFNEDGTENGNQMLESTCYNGSKIVLAPDGTLAYHIKKIVVDEVAGTSACSDEYVGLGTWVLDGGSGTTAVIDATYEAENGDTIDITLNKTGSQLQLYSILTQYPDKNGDGDAYYNVGDLELLFKK